MLLGSFVEEYDEKENDDELDMSGSPTRGTISTIESFQIVGDSSQASSFQPLPLNQAPRDTVSFPTQRTQTGMTVGTAASRPGSGNYKGLHHR
jgi:hypothetical protein